MAADVYEVKVLGADTNANQFQCTSHWLSANLTPAPDPYDEAENVANSYAGTMDAAFMQCVAGDVSQHYIYCRRCNNGGGNAYLKTDADSGGWAGNVEVIGVGAQLRFITPTAKIVGKMFMPGIAPGMIAGDVIQPAYVTVLEAFLALLESGFNTSRGAYLQVVWSRPKNGPPPVAGHPNDIINWDYADKPGAQRKRMTPLF